MRVQLTLVAAGAALLAPTTLPDAPPPPVPGPQSRVRTGPEAHKPAKDGREEPVRAADLLAKVRDCRPVSRGRYRSDAGVRADIPVCGAKDAVFWKADMDIDCDGRPGRLCNSRTDPYFTAATAFPGSDGGPLDAERLPYIVVPQPSGIWDHREDGIRGGSVAAVVRGDRLRYAVVGDVGPRDVIGEASHAAARALGVRPDPRRGGTPSGVTYIVFKDSRVRPIDDRAAAERLGERLARRFLDED
ncbi:glycoside hydrolase family 75 protein [Streptomyces sp. NPDC052309]|uniref:glycoside hydrolase family 75 protein n=1 Tax=Streptomyces sp. NPDC052309 TaxID=3155421 RepID=UPI003442F988